MNAGRATMYVPLALAVLTAAVLQAVLIVRMPTISADGIIFTSIARDLEADPLAVFREQDQHPGYPAAMLAASRAVQWLGYRAEPESWMLGGRAISYACGLLSVVVAWCFARDLYDARVADFAAFTFAVLPLPRVLAADAQSDMPHALVYLTAAWLATSGIKSGRVWPLAGAGLASAIAYWIRPEGLEVFVAAVLIVAWLGLHAERGWRPAALAGATLAAATLLVAAPYAILAGKITSKQLPFVKQHPPTTYIEQVAASEQPQHAAEAATPADPPRAGNAPQQAAATSETIGADVVAGVPTPPTQQHSADGEARYTVGLVAKLGARGFGKLIERLCFALRYVFVPLFLLGQWEMVRRQTPRRVIAFLWLLASLHLVILLWVYFVSGYIASRHVLPVLGLAMPFTALGILRAGETFGGRLNARPLRVAMVTLAVCTLVVLPYSVRAYNQEFLPVIAATRWVQQHAPAGSGIVCNSPYVGFYGTLPTTVLKHGVISLEAALAQGSGGVNYDFVVLHVGAHDYRPQWLSQIEQRYRQVVEYHDPTWSRHPRKVLVFESFEAQARRRMGDSRF